MYFWTSSDQMKGRAVVDKWSTTVSYLVWFVQMKAWKWLLMDGETAHFVTSVVEAHPRVFAFLTGLKCESQTDKSDSNNQNVTQLDSSQIAQLHILKKITQSSLRL